MVLVGARLARAATFTMGHIYIVGLILDRAPTWALRHTWALGLTIRIFDAATITTRSELGASALTFNLAKARRLPWPGMGCIDEGLI